MFIMADKKAQNEKIIVSPNRRRRYVFNTVQTPEINNEFDVVIVGCGIAGIYTALHIDAAKKVALINKGEIKSGSSYYAQGGIAAVISKRDSVVMHIEDTIAAGAGLCDIEAVRVLVNEAPENIHELIDMNVPFDTNSEGELLITREGGHRERRIVHCGGDATGRETTMHLYHVAQQRENIVFMHNTTLIDILTNGSEAAGLLVTQAGIPVIFECANIVIATGGIGQVYNYTTNPRGAVGDGIDAAYRSGAIIESMEMVQFHPTTLLPYYETDRLFLISEAVRGEGGILRNRLGEAFMAGKHEMADLAPRDIVTREIYKEMQRIGDNHVYIDAGAMTQEFFSERFPTIYAECRKFNINIPIDFIPVRPAQHYHMGGIRTDLYGKTNIVGLYACGEAASTGIHGANRLASNSMQECLVFGRRCAYDINKNSRGKISGAELVPGAAFGKTIDINQVRGFYHEIKNLMSYYVGALRTTAGLLHALERLGRIMDFIDSADICDNETLELYNMTQTSLMVVESALSRKNNIGAHYVEDNVD